VVKIGLLSDTHGYIDPRWESVFRGVDEIWHAGDIGTTEVADFLSSLKPFRAVFGNIDGQDIRKRFPEKLRFTCEKTEVIIIHIGGYPAHYDRRIRNELEIRPPGMFISGHSHILKVIYDKKLGFLHINPGAAGIFGSHTQRTVVRFMIDGTDIKNLEVVEMGPRERIVSMTHG